MDERERQAQEVRAAAERLRRETGVAAEELGRELQAAGREALDAMRVAMEEARRALREVRQATSGRGGGGPDAASGPGAEAAGAGTGAGAERAGRAERPTRAERRELTRELLLDAAAEVFAQKGYHGASLDDVAEAAGFTKGAVYSNFATKAELFSALLERHGRLRGAALARAMADVPLERLPDMVGEWLARQAGSDREWAVLQIEFWLAAMRDPSMRERLCAARGETMASLAAAFDSRLAAAGRRSGLDGRELAIVADAMAAGLLVNSHLDPELDVSDLFARTLRKLLADTWRP